MTRKFSPLRTGTWSKEFIFLYIGKFTNFLNKIHGSHACINRIVHLFPALSK